MKALILNNKVVDLAETEFEVHSSLTWVDCDDTVETGMTYDGSNFFKTTITLEMAMANLRQKRNVLLSATDYLALSDNTMSANVKAYRQALRDITEGLTTKEEVEAVEFPTKP
jgi:hypothetical protein